MRLIFVPPPEGRPLVEGKLMTEDGEVVEGVMTVSVWDAKGRSANAVSLQFVMLLEAIPDLPEERVSEAIDGLLAISQANS
jgi:hypothetical protein